MFLFELMFSLITDTSAFLRIIKKMQTENIKSMRIKDKAADDYNEVCSTQSVNAIAVDVGNDLAPGTLRETNCLGREMFLLVPPWYRWLVILLDSFSI
jgi:hypothetical protein